MGNLSRRGFAAVAGVTALSYSRILGANDRLRMGYIGLGNRGDQVHEAFLEFGDATTVAVCDLRDDYMDFAAKRSRVTLARFKDYRKLLDDKNVDAVAIATPDHWHAIMFVDACHAGKDVYCEKPLSLTVTEGRRMVEVAGETKRVVQVGIQRRSNKYLQEAAQFVREGGLGKVTVARGFHLQNEWPNGIGTGKDATPPTEEEWDRWLGPAPKVPYNRNRAYYNFRWFYHYSGGQITNFGVHYMDMLRWCLGKESPRAVTAMGGNYAVADNREIPDTAEVLWDFDGTMISFVQYNANSAQATQKKGADMELRGTKGTMYLYSNGYEVVPELTTERLMGSRTPLDRNSEQAYGPSKKAAMEPRKVDGRLETTPHAKNFIDCVKSRAKCNCDILTGHISTSNTHLGHIALRTESYLKWDGKAERFTNSATANGLLSYKYRPPYKLG